MTTEELKPDLFGPIYRKYSRKGQEAVDFLLTKRKGEVPNALFHKKIGWIDLVWGYSGTRKSDGYGLSKIEQFHPEILDKLESTLKEMKIISSSENRHILENKDFRFVISRNYFEHKKTWILTAYKIA